MAHPHNHGHATMRRRYTFKDFLPLIAIFSAIITFTLVRQILGGWNLRNAMHDFMGSFFIVFGFFKILKWRDFAEAYATYDLIAKRSMLYSYAYPPLELALGTAYLTHFQPFWTNIFTVMLMSINSLGVGNELRKKKAITCACLGTVFKFPMTKVTLFEDFLMAAMAFTMLFME